MNARSQLPLRQDDVKHMVWTYRDIETFGAVNQAFAHFWGLNREDFPGKHLRDVYGFGDAKLCMEGNRKVISSKETLVTHQWIRNGGKLCQLEITKTPLLNCEGNVELILCSAPDNTTGQDGSRQVLNDDAAVCRLPSDSRIFLANKKFYQSERTYEGLFSRMPYGAAYCRCVLDRSGCLVDYTVEAVNASFLRIARLQEIEVLDRQASQVFTGEQGAAFLKLGLIKQAVYGQKVVRYEVSVRSEDQCLLVTVQGSTSDAFMLFIDEISEFRSKQPGCCGRQSIGGSKPSQPCPDLPDNHQQLKPTTDQEQDIKRRLAIKRHRLETTLASIGDGVVITTLDARVEMINPAAQKILECEGIAGGCQDIDQIFVLTDGTFKLSQVFSRMDESGWERSTGDLNIITSTGKQRVISPTISPISGEEGIAYGFVVVFRDITEQRKEEAHHAMVSKMETLGSLVAGIAHELSTPIQYIANNLLFLEEIHGRLTEGVINHREQVEKLSTQRLPASKLLELASKHLDGNMVKLLAGLEHAVSDSLEGMEVIRQLIVTLKDFTHPRPPVKQWADINKAVRLAATITRNEWKHVASLELLLAPDLPQVLCVIDEIQQVLLNLIVNGVQAIAEAQRTREYTGTITISTELVDKFVLIQVEDDGIGVCADIVDNIFDPFFTTKPVGVGTGQGLAIAKHIIEENHDGRTWVKSVEGKTIFCVKLPVEQGSEHGLEGGAN